MRSEELSRLEALNWDTQEINVHCVIIPNFWVVFYTVKGKACRHILIKCPYIQAGQSMFGRTMQIINCDYLSFMNTSSVQFSRSVVSDSLRPHESQHVRPPCPSPTPGVHSDSHPSSQWCHLILCRPLLLLPPSPPSIKVFANESTLRMRWPKYWSFFQL